uniref:BCL2 binding component 3 n=1 Tax=Neolamprologus brichardi TaxID=32507 RepID=A0A3Q4HDG6_NEOBR
SERKSPLRAIQESGEVSPRVCILEENLSERFDFNPCKNKFLYAVFFSSADSSRQLQQPSSRLRLQYNMLPRNERPSWASPRRRAPGGEAVQEQEIRRVANQLRTIGDELNVTLLRRHGGPHWHDFRDVCRGLLSFITQTLSTLYRLT